MKIFLNDRMIEFVPSAPVSTLATDMVVHFNTEGTLKNAWEDFVRYDKYKTLRIIDPDCHGSLDSAAFKSFCSFFKFIPAAGGLVKNENGEFLFIHRLGFWDLPKGKISKKDIPHPGCTVHSIETARVAAGREVQEETGLKTVRILRDLPATWHIYISREHYCLKRTLWFEMEAHSGQTLKPETREGIFLVKWTPPDGIHCVLAHTYASIRELLLEIIF